MNGSLMGQNNKLFYLCCDPSTLLFDHPPLLLPHSDVEALILFVKWGWLIVELLYEPLSGRHVSIKGRGPKPPIGSPQ